MEANRAVVFFCPDSTGHLNPMLGLADLLVKQGWEVHFYIPKSGRQFVEGVGCQWHHMGSEEFSIPDAAREVIRAELALDVTTDINRMPFSVVPATLAVLPSLLRSVAQLAPRFVVHDACAPWGSIVAEAFQVPVVSLMSALPSPMATRDKGSSKYSHESLAILDAVAAVIKKDYGIDFNHNHSYEMYAPCTLITSSRAWHNGHEQFPSSQFHYWGPLISERKGSTANQGNDAVERLLSDSSLGQKGRPFFFCSLGTVTTGEAFALFGAAAKSYYQKLCRAAALLPHVTLVFAVGKVADVVEEEDADGLRRIVELFGEPVPENVVVARSVDQPKVLARANGFLTHCGQNSANEAVLAAVPVITAPFFGDQISNALRFEELGCGLPQSFYTDLNSTSPDFAGADLSLVSPDSLSAAMRRLLEEPQFQEAMLALRTRQEAELSLSMVDRVANLVAEVDEQAKKRAPRFSDWALRSEPNWGGA